ncbi:hypothetical protein HDU86_000369 [Geranomyces michiganensis]|nr:hypothetical protein HDU86_000369 [Geranomyces michiganensis]
MKGSVHNQNHLSSPAAPATAANARDKYSANRVQHSPDAALEISMSQSPIAKTGHYQQQQSPIGDDDYARPVHSNSAVQTPCANMHKRQQHAPQKTTTIDWLKENLSPQDNTTPLRVKELPRVRFGPMITPVQARVLNISTGWWSPSMETPPPPGGQTGLDTPGGVANLLRARQNFRSTRTLGTLDDIGFLSDDSDEPPDSPAVTVRSSRLSGGSSRPKRSPESRTVSSVVMESSTPDEKMQTTGGRGNRSVGPKGRPRTPKTRNTDQRKDEMSTIARRSLDSKGINTTHATETKLAYPARGD